MKPINLVKETPDMPASLMAWGRGPRMKKTALVVAEKIGALAGVRLGRVANRLEVSELVVDSP